MILDNVFNFASGQSLTGTSDVNSTNIYDAGLPGPGAVAIKVFDGGGRPFKVMVEATASGGTNPTIRARLVGADDAALTSNVIILADTGVSRVLTASDLPWTAELVPSSQMDAKRYYGVIWTQSGTNPTATVSANGVIDAQSAGLH